MNEHENTPSPSSQPLSVDRLGDDDVTLPEGAWEAFAKELPPHPAALNFERLEQLFPSIINSLFPPQFLQFRPDFKVRYKEFVELRSQGVPQLAQGMEPKVHAEEGTTNFDGGIYKYRTNGPYVSTGEDKPDFAVRLAGQSMGIGVVCKPERLLEQANAALQAPNAPRTMHETAKLLAEVCKGLLENIGASRSQMIDNQLVIAGILSERLRVESLQHYARDGKKVEKGRDKGGDVTSQRSFLKWDPFYQQFVTAREKDPELTIYGFCANEAQVEPMPTNTYGKRLENEIDRLQKGLTRHINNFKPSGDTDIK